MSGLLPNLMVDDISTSLAYYQRVGFAVVNKLPETEPVWALLELGDTKISLQTRSSLIEEFPVLADQKRGGALTLWISTPDVKSLFEQAKTQSDVVKPLGVTEYNGATEFVLMDPDGFILHFSDLVL